MSRIEKRRLTSYVVPVRRVRQPLLDRRDLGSRMLTTEMLIIHAMGGFTLGGFALPGRTFLIPQNGNPSHD